MHPGMLHRHRRLNTNFLINSTAQGIKRSVRDLLQMGADANVMYATYEDGGDTALPMAMMNGHSDVFAN